MPFRNISLVWEDNTSCMSSLFIKEPAFVPSYVGAPLCWLCMKFNLTTIHYEFGIDDSYFLATIQSQIDCELRNPGISNFPAASSTINVAPIFWTRIHKSRLGSIITFALSVWNSAFRAGTAELDALNFFCFKEYFIKVHSALYVLARGVFSNNAQRDAHINPHRVSHGQDVTNTINRPKQ